MIKTAFFASCLASIGVGIQLQACTSAYAELLAEMTVDTNYGTCMVVSNRAKAGQANIDEMKKFKGQSGAFEDPAFPHNYHGIVWFEKEAGALEADESFATNDAINDQTWKRMSTEFPSATLFGSENIRP